MKKILTSVLLVCLLIIIITTVAFAVGTDTYKIDELGMSIAIPSDYVVFTRDIDANDPNLSLYGLTKDSMSSLLSSSNVYLNAWDSDVNYEIIVNMIDSPLGDFNKISDTALSILATSLESEYIKSGITSLKSEVYQHAQAKFLKIYISQPIADSTIYGLQYSTVYANKAINITMQSYSGTINVSKENILKSIVDSVVFDTQPDFKQTTSQSTVYQEATKQVNQDFVNSILYKGLVGGLAGGLMVLGAGLIGLLRHKLKKRKNPSSLLEQTTNEDSRSEETAKAFGDQIAYADQTNISNTSVDAQHTTDRIIETITFTQELRNQIDQCKQVYPLFDFERETHRRTTGGIFSNLIRSGVNVTIAYESIANANQKNT